VVGQLELLKTVVGVLESLGIRYAIVGSWGSGAWGEARFTNDIDIAVELTEDDAGKLAGAFPLPEYYISAEAARDAARLSRMFNLTHPTSGIKVDFMVVGRDEWERSQLSRRRELPLGGGFSAYVAAPEDIIIGKLRYYRLGGSDKHLRDITGMMKVSGEMIDRAYVARWAEKLGLSDIWHAILERLGEPTA